MEIAEQLAGMYYQQVEVARAHGFGADAMGAGVTDVRYAAREPREGGGTDREEYDVVA